MACFLDESLVTPHESWVAGGHCPAIHPFKNWCNGQKGHEGDHWSPYYHPGWRVERVYWSP